MAEYYGWAGKILRIDLTTGEITTQDDAKYHKYIGGMGMAYRIMYEEAPMDLDPYDEKAFNKDNGKVSNGLINRRASEWNIFSKNIYKRI
jgi:aldehyde:ferredoxin oxidoreductase